MHVGIIALAIELALQLAGVPRSRANILTIAAVVVYVAVIGAPIPAVRAAIMLNAFLASRLAQRPTSRWAIVALGAAQPLVDPRVVLDAGYQLSVVGVTSMIAAGRVARRIGVHRLPSLARAPALILIGTTVATIGSAPIVAWVFGRISLAAPLTNLVATPLLELAQPMLFIGMLLAPIHPLASLLADAAHPLLGSLDRVATVTAATPGASILVAPTSGVRRDRRRAVGGVHRRLRVTRLARARDHLGRRRRDARLAAGRARRASRPARTASSSCT